MSTSFFPFLILEKRLPVWFDSTVPDLPIDDENRRHRLAMRHRLVPAERTDDVLTIVDDVVAVHSSDPVTVFVSLAARMQNPSVAAIEHALYEDRAIVRHHAMRRTLWVMSPPFTAAADAACTRRCCRGGARHRRGLHTLGGARRRDLEPGTGRRVMGHRDDDVEL